MSKVRCTPTEFSFERWQRDCIYDIGGVSETVYCTLPNNIQDINFPTDDEEVRGCWYLSAPYPYNVYWQTWELMSIAWAGCHSSSFLLLLLIRSNHTELNSVRVLCLLTETNRYCTNWEIKKTQLHPHKTIQFTVQSLSPIQYIWST